MPTHRWGDYTPSGHLGRILDDKTPQLGGMLDGNGFTFNGAVAFEAKAGEALSKGNAVYVSGVSGNKPVVMKADADDAAKMPAFGIAETDASLNANVNVVTFGTVYNIDTSAYSAGDELYVSTTAGELTATKPTGATAKLQNIGKVIRSHASAGSIKVGGAGRTNAVPNLDDGTVFIGDSNNQAEQRALVLADISDYTAPTETDPVYTASSWYTTTNNSSNWDTAYSWGDHSTQNYAVTTGDTFTGELALANNVKVRFDNTNDANYDVTLGSYYDYDAFFQVKDGGGVTRFSVGRDSHAYVGGAGTAGNKLWDEGDFTSTNISNWNTAYGWGNHASAGYLTAETFAVRGTMTNADASQASGVYRINSGVTSQPGGSVTNYGTVVHFNNVSDTGFQIACDYNSASFYFRGGNSSTFGGGGSNQPWSKVWCDNNDGSGSGLDADTVDGIQASSFLRSDANDTTTGKLSISVASNATDLLRVASTTSYGYMSVAGINGSDAGLIFQEGTSNRCMLGHDQSADTFRIYWYNDTNGNVINNNRLTLTSSGNLYVTGNITGARGLVSGQTGARYPIKLYSSSWPEIQMFRGSTEELRIGAAETASGYGTSAGDFYVYDSGTNKINLNVPSNGGSFKRNNGAYTVWDSGNDGSGSGLDADTVDGFHATSFRTVGGGIGASAGTWYTIAYNVGNRASARFHIRDVQSSRHQSVHFYASHMYGNGNAINVVHSNVFSTSPIRYIRIKEGGTYDGALLQVYFDSASTFQAFMYENDQASGWVLLNTPVVDGSSTGISVGNFSALTNVGAQVDVDKSVRGGFIGTGNLYMDGNITAYSDKRVKANLEIIPDALNKVKSLSGYTFDRTDQFKDDGRQTGLVAQEVLEVLPEAVIGDEEGGYALAYGNMVGLLIEAIKEQQAQIEDLKEMIKCQ